MKSDKAIIERFEIIKSPTEVSSLSLIAGNVKDKLKETLAKKEGDVNVVMPSGSTANKFFPILSERLKNVDLGRVHFYVGEDFYPLDLSNKVSFSGQFKKYFADITPHCPDSNFHYISPERSLKENLEQMFTLSNGADVFITGLNESGAVCALRSGLQYLGSSLYNVIIEIGKTKDLCEPLEDPPLRDTHQPISNVLDEFVGKYFPNEDDRPTHFLTYGYLPLINSNELIVLGTGNKKKKAIERVLPGLIVAPTINGKEFVFEKDRCRTTSLADVINARHSTRLNAYDREVYTAIYVDSSSFSR